MTSQTQIGQVVWHDLLTNDVENSKLFYAELLGWEYHVEHSANFAWNSGEADYPLIFVNGEAHGGFVDPGKKVFPHWLAYVMVENVDDLTAKARAIGAYIDREAFDIPGVGRAAVIRDPLGATICPYVPTHDLPPPTGTFIWDELVTENIEHAKRIYADLFDWRPNDVDVGQQDCHTVFKRDHQVNAAGATMRFFPDSESATWVTYLATKDLDATIAKAKALGARVHVPVTNSAIIGQVAVLADPTGAVFGLSCR